MIFDNLIIFLIKLCNDALILDVGKSFKILADIYTFLIIIFYSDYRN